MSDQTLNDIIKAVKSFLMETKKDVSSFMNDSTASMHMESAQHVAQLEQLLMEGRLEEATQLAIQTKSWAHAILLSVMIDKATYQKVVTEFAMQSFNDGSPLRTLYMMFADRGDLLFQNSSVTDQYGNSFAPNASPSKIVENWEENLIIILSNRTAGIYLT